MWIYFIFILTFSTKIVCLQTCSNFENGIDRPGPWYAYIQTISSADACCNLCNDEGARCQSWVFVRTGATIAPGCYLKQNIPPINQASNCQQYCTSGFKQTSLIISGRCAYPGGIFELGVDRPGDNYVRLLNVHVFFKKILLKKFPIKVDVDKGEYKYKFGIFVNNV
ncbi:unnamed protein product [Rotaria sp. Silwood1]|nr:unnamed protein product [Rotaria sp. Silwood1]CAF4988277.1 unnamed protein product [Rotaria sp. Silwood1]